MQANSVRFLASLYSLFFVLLAIMVIAEGWETRQWTVVSDSDSVLVGLAALSGWFSKAIGLVNFLFGFGGGLFIDNADAQRPMTRATRLALYWLIAVMVVVTLFALWSVAGAYVRIDHNVTGLADANLEPSAALDTLGALNLGIAGGFLIGLAIPPPTKAGD